MRRAIQIWCAASVFAACPAAAGPASASPAMDGTFVTRASGGTATVTAHDNSFRNNLTGANGDTGTSVDAENNWWGCKRGPNMGGVCDTAIGTVDFSPWLTRQP